MARYQFLIGLLVLGHVSLAQTAPKEWTLSECVDEALRNNLQLQRSRLNTQQAQSDYTQAFLSHTPSINASAGQGFNFGRSIDPFTNQFKNQTISSSNFSLNGSLTVFAGMQVHSNRKAQMSNLEATRQDEKVTVNNIALTVANNYLQVLLAAELVKSARLQLEQTSQQLTRTETLAEAGVLTKGNVLEIKAQQANDELNLVNAENQLRLAYLSLTQNMNLKYDTSFKVQIPAMLTLPLRQDASIDAIFESASQNRPELAAALARQKAARYSYHAALGSRSPRITLNGTLSTLYSDSRLEITGATPVGEQVIGYVQGSLTPVVTPNFNYLTRVTPFSNQLQDNFGRQVFISMSLPIYNGWQVNNSINRARINRNIAQVTMDQTNQQLYREVAQASLDFMAAKQKYDAARKGLEAQQLSLEFAQNRYEQGLLNTTDYLNIRTNYQRAEANFLQSKYEFIFRDKVLDFYQGKSIQLN